MKKKVKNAVNDCLSGLHVGDSAPVSLEQLTLSQKIDYTLDGKPKPLPLLRETLIPGTEICLIFRLIRSYAAMIWIIFWRRHRYFNRCATNIFMIGFIVLLQPNMRYFWEVAADFFPRPFYMHCLVRRRSILWTKCFKIHCVVSTVYTNIRKILDGRLHRMSANARCIMENYMIWVWGRFHMKKKNRFVDVRQV